MQAVKTVLLTGSTGLLGKGMVETRLPGFDMVGVHLRDYAPDDRQVDHRRLDLSEPGAVASLFGKHHFDCVVHAAGIANVDYVEHHYEEGLASNLHLTMKMVNACRQHGSHLIYISTNAVFDGGNAPYAETSPPHPINQYGKIKLACEKYVSDHLDHFTILRPILMYGWHYPQSRMNPATWLIQALQKGETVRMVQDVFENPLYNIQCGEILWQCVLKKPCGIIHAAGGEVVSRYEFARQLAGVFGFSPDLIRPVDSSFFPAIAPRPVNTSFDTRWIEREWGIVPLSVREGLERMKADGR